ncbi:MAG: hypothetical protein JXA89_12440 [Anaerolineae bacterium]|nr:hypothetical protein [Anaerolineae bacterium]
MKKAKATTNHGRRRTLCFRLPNGVIWTVISGNVMPSIFPGCDLGHGIKKEKITAFGFCQTSTLANLPERIQIL